MPRYDVYRMHIQGEICFYHVPIDLPGTGYVLLADNKTILYRLSFPEGIVEELARDCEADPECKEFVFQASMEATHNPT